MVGVAVVAVATTLVVVRPSSTEPDFLAIEAAEAAAPAPETTTSEATTTTSTLPATTTTVVAETTTSSVAPAATLTTVLSQTRVTGLGDSVLLEAKAELERRLPDASIDAEVARQFEELLALAKAKRDAGQLGPHVILQLGNNGPVTASQFDEIMEVLAAAQRVVVINVKVPRPWEAPNNDMMAAGVKRWPNAVLLDWHRYGAAHPELGDDGTHMGPTGFRVFVELVLAAF